MSRLAGAFLLLCLHAGFVHGMDCSFGTSKNFIEKTLQTCPGLLDPSYKSYCCLDIPNDRTYCCDAEEFALKTGLGIIIPIIITAAIVISLIVCCVSCLCCSCCPWYRRRRPGAIYGTIYAEDRAPAVVHVVQNQANLPPSYSQAQAQNLHGPTPPSNLAGYPQQPPPQYSSEAYAKQAPYNPAYPPQ